MERSARYGARSIVNNQFSTLRDAEGHLDTFKADDRVRNLAQVHKGDQVVATYHESVEIELKKKGKATPGVTEDAAVSLKGPEGKRVRVHVKNAAHLENAKVGDLVQITYTEAVAIAVEKPASTK